MTGHDQQQAAAVENEAAGRGGGVIVSCRPERSEGPHRTTRHVGDSLFPVGREILRCAQDDKSGQQAIPSVFTSRPGSIKRPFMSSLFAKTPTGKKTTTIQGRRARVRAC